MKVGQEGLDPPSRVSQMFPCIILDIELCAQSHRHRLALKKYLLNHVNHSSSICEQCCTLTLIMLIHSDIAIQS